MKKLSATILISAILLVTGGAWADVVTIVNLSFESPNVPQQFFVDFSQIPGWDLLQGDAGIWNIDTGANGATHGTRSVYLGAQDGARPTAVITQLLAYLISDGDQFELSFDGWSWSAGVGVRAELYYLDALTPVIIATDDFIASVSGTAGLERYTLILDTPLPSGAIDQNLGILFTTLGPDDQYTGLDSVTLTVTPGGGDIPEPATMGLLAAGGIALLKRRRK